MGSDLGPVYLSLGLVTETDLAAARQQVRSRPDLTLAGALEALGIVEELALTKAVCHQEKLPFVDLARARTDPRVAAITPPGVVEEFRVIAIRDLGGQVILATDDPRVSASLHTLEGLLGRSLSLALSPPTAFRRRSEGIA